MEIDAKTTVGELVLEIPGASRVFDAHRIDYCCGGARSLSEACSVRGVDCDRVVAELARVEAARIESDDVDWRTRPLGELVDHVVATHHEYARAELTRLRAPLEKVVKVHGAAHPELAAVARLFDQLEQDLLPHMVKEERILFPFIGRLAAATPGSPTPAAPFGAVQGPVRVMMFEHERDGAVLDSLRTLTSDYALPQGACITYAVLYEGLRKLDLDLRRHIHLENNVLFPRALEAERDSRLAAPMSSDG